WDGIKRDRLVWLGDLHPEVMTVSAVFGYNEVIPKSLDLARDITPLPGWMNGMCSYSLWWIIIQRDWYKYQGSLSYLGEQQSYLTELLQLLLTKVDASGREKLDGGGRFLDWPSSPNTKGVDAGLQALTLMAFQAGGELCAILGDRTLAAQCAATVERMKTQVPPHNQLKQAAALLALADMLPAGQADSEVISVDGARNFSTFYGYYMLQAQAKAGNCQGAVDNIRRFWGGMLDMGATTFWEDFNLDWLENAAGIDEPVPEGKKDIHADFGAYCYENLRHSLCHGWASGPTAWLSEHVLGVKVVVPGCKVLKIEPCLGDLEWVEGTFPTPQGVVSISHRKGPDGKVKTAVKAPKGVKIIH
ncbi:MAG: alpha-L-rhamnosidase, partial [Tannerella sp.]|nr:alpha-L-rhamnosidase [Tannerella sp.]